MKAVVSWSGGKDSCYAMQKAVAQGYTPVVLLNILNENGKISRSHGLPVAVLEAQASSMNLPIICQPSTWTDYEENFIQSLLYIKKTYGVEAAIFGDIDLEQHKAWEEKVCAAAGLKAILPLWKQNRRTLVFEMIQADMDAYIVSCNTVMGVSFLGKKITTQLVPQLEKLGIDACGENGEYHTVVTNCNTFTKALKVTFSKKTQHDNYCFTETIIK